MAQTQYAVGTVLETPFGKTIKVEDPNAFYSESYKPTKATPTVYGSSQQSLIANDAAANTLAQAYLGRDAVQTELGQNRTVSDLEAFYGGLRASEGVSTPIRSLDSFKVTPSETDIPNLPVPKGEAPPFTPPTPTAPTEAESIVTGLAADLANIKDQLKRTYEEQAKSAKEQADVLRKQMDEISKKQEGVMQDVEAASQPFRADLEKSERERLKIEENFFANQKTIGELESLMNTALEEVKAAKEKTGLEVIRNPRITAKINDFNARIGVLQAVISARNGQISVAENLIDRTANALNADRRDQLAYFNSVLNYYDGLKDDKGREVLSLKGDEKKAIEAQISLVENDMGEAQEVANVIKSLMITDPGRVEGSGITLNDDLGTISKKLSDHDYRQEWTDIKNQMVAKDFEYLSTMDQVNRMRAQGRQVIAVKDSRGVDNFFAAPLPKPKTVSSGSVENERKSEMNGALAAVSGSDGYVSPDDWRYLRKQWVDSGGNPSDFDSKFKGFKNPNNDNY